MTMPGQRHDANLDFDAHLAAESSRFRAALAAADPEAPVPTCPEWTAADLLWHLAEVQHFWSAIVSDRLSSPESVTPPQRPDTAADLFNCFDEGHARLVASLQSTSDDVAVWTWAASAQTVGFVRRRQAHEALIHRLDAEATFGDRTPLDSQLAADGVAEVLEHVFGDTPEWGEITRLERCGKFRAVDTGHEWTLQVGRWQGLSPTTGTRYDDELMLQVVADGDIEFEVAGTAADLDAWLWSRPTTGELTRSGDLAAVDELIASGVE